MGCQNCGERRFIKEEEFERPLISRIIATKLCDSVQEMMENVLLGSGTSNHMLHFHTKSVRLLQLLTCIFISY